jgi:hypothetical protein
MKCASLVAVVSVLSVGVTIPAAGQSLADLARQEAARRKTVTAGKTFTNADLKPVPPPSPGAVASAPGTTLTPPPPLPGDDPVTPPAADSPTPPAATTPAPAAAAPTDERGEAYWRGRVSTARDNLARSQTFQLALQARIAALNTDFVNRDDPAQRATVAGDRQKAQAELDRVQKDITRYQTELTTIADEARRAGVPAAWVR